MNTNYSIIILISSSKGVSPLINASENGICLIRPGPAHKDQVLSFKKELSDARDSDSFAGCALLEETDTYEEWLDFEGRLKKRYGSGYVPSEIFLAVRTDDGKVVGIIDFRHPLTNFLRTYGGNIGYSIRPGERRKGYGAQMLHLLLPVCRSYGEKQVIITCDRQNEASRRTILKNGGVLENEIPDTVGLCNGGTIQRYVITL